MTRNEARKIIKSHAPSKYSNSAVLLLLKLVDATYLVSESKLPQT